jgi:hypothetical protein
VSREKRLSSPAGQGLHLEWSGNEGKKRVARHTMQLVPVSAQEGSSPGGIADGGGAIDSSHWLVIFDFMDSGTVSQSSGKANEESKISFLAKSQHAAKRSGPRNEAQAGDK